MRILLIVDCYLPSTKSSAKLTHDLAAEFHRQGHEVIVTAPDDTLNTPKQLAVKKGVTILRIRTAKIKGAVKIVRAFNESRLSSIIWRTGRSFFKANPCDLIVYYSPSIFWGRLVQKLKKIWNCKSYLILRDIFPQWAIDTGVLKEESLVTKYFRMIEKQLYDTADIIAVQSPSNLEYFSDSGIEKKYHLKVLYNWATIRENEIPHRDDSGRLGLQDKVVFFYGGNIGIAQDMDNIIRLAENMREVENVYFLLVGDGSEVPRLKAKIHQDNLKNITILPALPQDQYLGLLSQFDVGLISLERNLKTHNIPGKMLGYMYFSMPILACINPGNDLKQIIEDGGAGLVCLGGEDQRLCEYTKRLAADVNLRRQMGRNAREILEETFDVTNTVAQILSDVKDIAPCNSDKLALRAEVNERAF
jgi:glycosyltransferase involved in cell wall biosynthesis